MKKLLLVMILGLSWSCAADVATSAATVAEQKKQETEQAEKTAEKLKQDYQKAADQEKKHVEELQDADQ